ncbi:MAG TPA: zinc dependent phospholipase C family protein, partial [Chitinophagaceae bacterium]
MKHFLLLVIALGITMKSFCWGFFAHRRINYYAVFLLPPEMLKLYKSSIDFITLHATDPDKRRYVLPSEAPKHFLDIDHYGTYPFPSLPVNWADAVAKFGRDSLEAHGIVPWWVAIMVNRLTTAFREKNKAAILKLSADLGHYVADAHVPLHTSSNHNGQLTGQVGIHAFWESRVPELLADTEWDFFIGTAVYVRDPQKFIWQRVLESAAAADSVLKIEKQLTAAFGADKKFAYEERNGTVLRQYSSAFTRAYNDQLRGMIERRMREAIFSVASLWYTA